MKFTVLPWALIIFLISFQYAPAQTDSLVTQQNDSLLNLQQQQTQQLLKQADSVRLSDSLAQVLLLAQISELQAKDARTKALLQARLDSLKNIQDLRDLRVRQQVDSVRANTKGVPVVAFNDTLFYIYAKLGAYKPSDRAKSIAQKLERLVDEHQFDPQALEVYASEESHDLVHGDLIILSVTDRDAFWQNESRAEVAAQYAAAIKNSVTAYREATSIWQMGQRVGLLILVLFIFYLGIKYMNRGFTHLNRWVIRKGKKLLKGIRFKDYEFLTVEKEEQVIRFILKTLKWLIISLVVYLSLPLIFSIFPATEGIAAALLSYILTPIKTFLSALIGYIPELFTIVVILTLTFYFVRFLGFLSGEVEKGKLQLPGFYPDWAAPTFKLLRVVIYAFAFIVIFPYLPGSDSPVFQGVSVFFGLLISLGSSSAIGNIIAGLVITYMRAFKIGDRVKIGDTVGDVLEKTLLVTRLRTIKNEEVTIPNSAILNGSTVNYSTSALESGLVLHSTVTIGYDVPWRQVHELLITAAKETEHIMTEPRPFVLQTSLDDFYVSYQINAYTFQPELSARIYSQLHANIQDAFNEAGLEILSPHYRAARDGNMVTIPASYLPADYQPPAFTVNMQRPQPAQAKSSENHNSQKTNLSDK